MSRLPSPSSVTDDLSLDCGGARSCWGSFWKWLARSQVGPDCGRSLENWWNCRSRRARPGHRTWWPCWWSRTWLGSYSLCWPWGRVVLCSMGTPGWGYSFGCRCCPVPRLRGGWDSLLDVGEGVPGGVVSDTVSLAHVEVL